MESSSDSQVDKEEYPILPLITTFNAGNAMDEDVENFINCGADLVLTKPLKINQLEALLAHCKNNGFQSVVDGMATFFFIECNHST